MCDGIHRTAIFVAFITTAYVDKVAGKGEMGQGDHCKREFQYAVNKVGPKNMLAAVTETRCLNPQTWHGSVGFNLGSTLYVNLTAVYVCVCMHTHTLVHTHSYKHTHTRRDSMYMRLDVYTCICIDHVFIN